MTTSADLDRLGNKLGATFPLFGTARRRGAIKKLAAASELPEAVPHLVAGLASADPVVASRARQALLALPTPAARDALIDLLLRDPAGQDLPALIREAGYRHSDEGRHFLLLAISGRFDEYLADDFQFQRLRIEFSAAHPDLQQRVRDSISRSGDTRMNGLLVAEKRQTVLADLSPADAELLVQINARNRNFDDLFKYLPVLPARSIATAVRAMRAARWAPGDDERRALFARLATLVDEIGEAPPPIRNFAPLGPVMKAWCARGETGDFARLPEAELRGKIREEVPPPDQIAALAALRASGKLGPGDLDSAARSPHWMVRVVAAAFGGPPPAPEPGGSLYIRDLAPAFDCEAVWGGKPFQVTRDGLEELTEGLARIPDKRKAGGLHLVAAVASHAMAHDIQVDVGAHVVVSEDAIEIGG